MASFSHKTFDARDYVRARPFYPQTIFDLVFAYHAQGAASSAANLGQAGGEKTENQVHTVANLDLARWEAAVDVGCGIGQGTFPLLSRFSTVTGVDLSAAMVSTASSLDPSSIPGVPPFPSHHTIAFKEGSGEATGLPDQSVDLVVAATAVHWFDWFGEPGGAKVWNEMARIVRKGGTLAFWGYPARLVVGKPVLNRYVHDLFYDPDGLGNYYDTSPTSGYVLQATLFDSIPMPSPPPFVPSDTLHLKLDVDPTFWNCTEPEPLPAWAKRILYPSDQEGASQPQAVFRTKMTFAKFIDMYRSSSGYVSYLSEHPEDKGRAEQNQDLMGKWFNEARWAQAKADADVGASEEEEEAKLIDWEDEVDVYYPLSILFVRRSLV